MTLFGGQMSYTTPETRRNGLYYLHVADVVWTTSQNNVGFQEYLMGGSEYLYHTLNAIEVICFSTHSVSWHSWSSGQAGDKGTYQASMSTPRASSLRWKKVLFGFSWTSNDGSTGWGKGSGHPPYFALPLYVPSLFTISSLTLAIPKDWNTWFCSPAPSLGPSTQ